MTRTKISNSAYILDVRDIIARFEELEAQPARYGDEADEYTELMLLLSGLEGSSGTHQWKGGWYPVTLIRDSYFADYCKALLGDIDALPPDLPGYLAIDWDTTVKNLRADHRPIEFDGVEYWYR